MQPVAGHGAMPVAHNTPGTEAAVALSNMSLEGMPPSTGWAQVLEYHIGRSSGGCCWCCVFLVSISYCIKINGIFISAQWDIPAVSNMVSRACLLRDRHRYGSVVSDEAVAGIAGAVFVWDLYRISIKRCVLFCPEGCTLGYPDVDLIASVLLASQSIYGAQGSPAGCSWLEISGVSPVEKGDKSRVKTNVKTF